MYTCCYRNNNQSYQSLILKNRIPRIKNTLWYKVVYYTKGDSPDIGNLQRKFGLLKKNDQMNAFNS